MKKVCINRSISVANRNFGTNKTHNRLGFTLMEMMIVIIIIGVLVTITTVLYTGIRKNAVDVAVQSDIEKMESLLTAYSLRNNVVGKAYYSGNGPDTDLGFEPGDGVVVDVVINDDDYCIRAYNTDGSKDSILNAYSKESSPGVCALLSPSSAALSVVPPSTVPNIVAQLVGNNVVVTVNEVICQGGETRYKIERSVDDGDWTVFSDWSTTRIKDEPVTNGTKYDYQSQSQCYTNENINSPIVSGGISTYEYNDDNLPVAASVSGYFSSAPDGYLLEDGSAVSRTTYADLFAVIGTTFGSGDGSTTFNLPDSRGRITVNKNASDTQFVTLGQMYGEKTHTILSSEIGLKGHNHTQNAHSHTKTVNFTNSFPGGTDRPLYYGIGTSSTATVTWDSTTATNQAVAASNASSAHNNIQPSIAKTFVIKYFESGSTTSKLPAGTSISGYWTSAPSGYLVEDGSIVSRATYSSLFTAIGTTFGSGDGSTTFGIPDSRGRVVVNKSSLDSEFDVLGEKYGEKIHLITGSESGENGHNHTQNAHSHSELHNFTNSFPGGTDRPLYYGIGTANTSTISVDNTTATNIAVASADAASAHNEIQPSIVKLTVIKHTPIDSTSDWIAKGATIQGYFSSAPDGYLLEDGSAVSRTTYADLFAVIGTTFGSGDGSTTFNLPDSRGRVAVNINPSDPEFDTLGEQYGSKTHLLTGAESGEKGHNHTQNPHGHTKLYNFTNSFPGGTDRPLYYGISVASTATVWLDNTTATNQAVVASNASSAHNNIQPSIVQNFAIRY